MIRKIRIENYKCYKKSTLSLKDIVVIVGNNNAGKSTLIEALRLVSYAAKNFKYCNYTELPSVFGLPKAQRGFKINAANLMIDLKCAIYQSLPGSSLIPKNIVSETFRCASLFCKNCLISLSQTHHLLGR